MLEPLLKNHYSRENTTQEKPCLMEVQKPSDRIYTHMFILTCRSLTGCSVVPQTKPMVPCIQLVLLVSALHKPSRSRSPIYSGSPISTTLLS